MMIRNTSWRRMVATATAGLALVGAQEDSKSRAPAKVAKVNPAVQAAVTELSLTPAGDSTPMLKHRLRWRATQIQPGNPVPAYLRIATLKPEGQDELVRLTTDLLKGPLESVDRKAGAELAAKFSYGLAMLEAGSRRRSADWGVIIREEDPFGTLLPDTQMMRRFLHFQSAATRVAIAEGRWEDAARDLRIGLHVSAHVADGSFLITGLVGLQTAQLALDRVEDWIGAAGSPNLHWPLTELGPAPIKLDQSIASEEAAVEMQHPELHGFRAERSPERWTADLERLHARMSRDAMVMSKIERTAMPSLIELRLTRVAQAKAWLVSKAGVKESSMGDWPADRVLLTAIGMQWESLRDLAHRGANLPHPDRFRLRKADQERRKVAAAEQLVPLSSLYQPLLGAVDAIQPRFERRLAMLRTIEALRMHLAANGGKFPAALHEVSVAPIPDDPWTGKPFAWKVTDNVGELTADDPLEPRQGRHYRLRVRP